MSKIIKALKEFLNDHKSDVIEYRQESGGCPTCGYGAEEFEVIDWDALMQKIDDFSESFKG